MNKKKNITKAMVNPKVLLLHNKKKRIQGIIP